MPDTTQLKEAANALIQRARQFIELCEADEAAEGAIPADQINVPPGTRAARQAAEQAAANRQAAQSTPLQLASAPPSGDLDDVPPSTPASPPKGSKPPAP